MTKKNTSSAFQKRHEARKAGIQILYRWQMNEELSRQLFSDFVAENNMAVVDAEYLQRLFLGVTENLAEVDEAITPALDRKLSLLNPVELAALRQATFELMQCVEVPYKVVINEAIELVKEFGADGGHKYINGVLDKLVLTLRKAETAS